MCAGYNEKPLKVKLSGDFSTKVMIFLTFVHDTPENTEDNSGGKS